MRVVVPDASVILKWVLPDPSGEEGLDAALRLRDAVISGKVVVKVPSPRSSRRSLRTTARTAMGRVESRLSPYKEAAEHYRPAA